jgi:hypothetical protein
MVPQILAVVVEVGLVKLVFIIMVEMVLQE